MFNHRCAALLFVPGWACKSFVGAPQHQMQDITGCVLAAAMDRSNTTNQKITASKHHSQIQFTAPTAAYVVAARAAFHSGELHAGTQRAREITVL